MRVLIIQENGRHMKNRMFRECYSFQRAFTSLGIQCDVWGLGHENYSIPFQEISYGCDVIFLIENYDQDNWVPSLADSSKLVVQWTVDAHCSIDYALRAFNKHRPNILFSSSEQYLHRFPDTALKYWLPNAYDNTLVSPMSPKVYDVGFCGNVCNRGHWIDTVGSWAETNGKSFKKDIFIIGEEMVKAVSSYKIHFNRNIADDINYRTFETCGCGTLLFTNFTPNLNKLFDLDRDIVVYQSAGDLVDKLRYYSQNEDKARDMALNGYRKASSRHTYTERAKLFMEIVENA